MKRFFPESGDAVAERGVGQIGAVIKGLSPDADDTVRNRYAGSYNFV